MTIRAVPCPRCRRVPETGKTEDGQSFTRCKTAGCRTVLYCLGKTEDESRKCWNGCIDREDYRWERLHRGMLDS